MYPDSRVTIETPEQITMELAPAGIGSRFLALALDTLIQGALYVVIILLGIWLGPISPDALAVRHVGRMRCRLLFVLRLLGLLRGVRDFLARTDTGQASGWGLRVVKDSGRPITAIEGIGRNLMRVIDGLLLLSCRRGLGDVSSQNKRLGDYVAGTVVVHRQADRRCEAGLELQPTGGNCVSRRSVATSPSRTSS